MRLNQVPVYIHTRDRLDNLRKIIPEWMAQPVGRIILVIEREDYFIHRRFLQEQGWWDRVELYRLGQRNAGMGNARHHAVAHANRSGYEVMLMSDDDIKPKPGSSISPLVEWTVLRKSMGIGVCVPFYGLTLGNDFIRVADEAVPVSGSWGYRLFALHVGMTVEAGNFDRRLDVGWEDHEVCRYGIRKYQVPWYIHTGAPAVSIDARYAPGGIAALYDIDERKRREKECHVRIYERWGERYISEPAKQYRCNWKRLLGDHGIVLPPAKRS